jgi:serine protease Do
MEDLLRRFFGPFGDQRLGPGQKGQRRSPGMAVPRQRGVGSGFILSADGYVVTNNHVVRGADEIKVRLSDEREYNARLVGQDPQLDLALLKLRDVKQPLPQVALGDSEMLRVGDPVIAIGNPFGLGNTVTQGIVSAKGRVIGAGPYDDFIQTDASINPGNSGGPLLDLRGAVVGINTAMTSQGQGIGFAIPINLAKSVLHELRTTGQVNRGFLGVTIQRITPALARTFGLEKDEGALVSEVRSGTPAARAGLKPGDVIVSFNGHPVRHSENLPLMVASLQPGNRAPLEVVRNKKRMRFEVTLERLPSQGTEQAGRRPAPVPGSLGLQVRPPTAGEKGVTVESVDPRGPAAELLQEGDVILQVGPRAIATPAQLSAAVRAVPATEEVPLLIEREGQKAWVAISRRTPSRAAPDRDRTAPDTSPEPPDAD